MCGTQYALGLIALYVGLAQSWDIAVSVGDRLEFYTNGTKTETVQFKSHNLTAIAYDEVHNMMLFIDKQSNHDAICGFNLASTDIKCFIKKYGSNIQDLAFDSATDLLFFTDTKKRSINWISLKDQEFVHVYHDYLLIKMDDRTVRNIDVDSCRGYIYWTNTYEPPWVHMERARFNGSERKVIYKYLPIYSFAIDSQTYTNYFIDGTESSSTQFLRKADLKKQYLNGETEKAEIKYVFRNHPLAPKELTVSNDYLYWMNSSVSHTTVWQRPKNAGWNVEPREISNFYNERPFGIAAKYRITERVQGLQDCEALSSLLIPNSGLNNSQNTERVQQNPLTTETYQTTERDQTTETTHSTDMEQTAETEQIAETEQTTETEQTAETKQIAETEQTPETEKIVEKDTITETNQIKEIKTTTAYTTEVKCTPGYIGERCNVSVCENYCLQGSCTFNDKGLPECRCNAGYFGKKCEVNACYGFCLHNGDCYLNEKSDPICQCKGHYVGDRCEVSGCLNYCLQGGCSFNDEGHPVCRCYAGYSGERCEVTACHGYCLNNGKCTLNEEDEPACQCVADHEGSRCEAVKDDTGTNTSLYKSVKRNLTLTDLLLMLHYTRN